MAHQVLGEVRPVPHDVQCQAVWPGALRDLQEVRTAGRVYALLLRDSLFRPTLLCGPIGA
eukprot:scaffold319465_cov34-Prasinocladus_malaysianus.AAC.2